jgi:AraC-like DNA-binding protein
MGDRERLIWLHFLPVLIQCLFYLSLTFRSFPYKTYFWINIHQPYTQKAELYASVLSIGIYIYFSIVLLQKYNRKINDYFSNTAHSTLKWLRNMLLGLLILYAGWLTEHLLGNFQYGIVHVLLPIYIYWLAWMGFQQRNILDVRLEEPKNVFSTTKSQPEVSPAMLLLIKQAMENDRLYRNPTLTLSDLARHVDLAPKSVSFIINSQLGKSFNSYVNEYRIDDFKQKLLAEQNSRFTILALALESGFNSQASFYRIFKEFTGVSPKEYQKSLSNQS